MKLAVSKHRGARLLVLLLVAALVAGALAPASGTAFRTGKRIAVPGNPVDMLAGQPMDAQPYDYAAGCDPRPRVGTKRLLTWLERNFKGFSYGAYRCEGTSLHSEWRAIDWGLDVRKPAQKREGARLIRLLLAPDKTGAPRALARRMGVEELIWDCSYWSTSASRAPRDFSHYSVCGGSGVDPTAGHLDHIHIGITVAGSYARTTFWRAGADALALPRRTGVDVGPALTGTPAGGLLAP